MALKNPLGMMKDVVAGSVKAPASAMGSAVGLAKGAGSSGLQLTRTATSKAVGTATSLAGGRTDSDRPGPDPAAQESDAKSPARPSDPVNVVEELGLDPAPVEKPKPSKRAREAKPVTRIDAAADASTVDVTPADVAEVVGDEGTVGQKSAD